MAACNGGDTHDWEKSNMESSWETDSQRCRWSQMDL